MTATEAKWSERVRDWRASGKTADEFSAGQGFEPTTLRYWASRLKAEATSKAAPQIARVVRVRSAPGSHGVAASELEVAVGATRIVVRRGFDAELLRQVADALGGKR